MISKEISRDRKFTKLHRFTRYHFIMLVTWADNLGRLEGDAEILKGMLYPWDPDVQEQHINKMNQVLAQDGFIAWYESDERKFIQVKNFGKWQTLKKRHHRSDFPSPSGRGLDVVQTLPGRGPGDVRPELELEVEEEVEEEKNNVTKKSSVDGKDGKYIHLVNLLRDHIRVFRKSKRFTAKWFENQHREIRLLIEKVGADEAEVEKVLRWLPDAPMRKGKNGDFTWRTVILSAASLREYFDKLAAEAMTSVPKQENKDAQRFRELTGGKADG